jgi:pyridoxine 5'-phosphate synthase PdxJ
VPERSPVEEIGIVKAPQTFMEGPDAILVGQLCGNIRICETVQTALTLEMAVGEDILGIALNINPDQACLVPEQRQELTTEGGLELSLQNEGLIACIRRLQANGTLVSLFMRPVESDSKKNLASRSSMGSGT